MDHVTALVEGTVEFFQRFSFKPDLHGSVNTLSEEVEELILAAKELDVKSRMDQLGQTNFLDQSELERDLFDEFVDVLVAGLAVTMSVTTPEDVELDEESLYSAFKDAIRRVLNKNAAKTELTHTVHNGKITRRSKIGSPHENSL